MKSVVLFFAFVALSTAVPLQYVRVGNKVFVVPDSDPDFDTGFQMPGFNSGFQMPGFNTGFQMPGFNTGFQRPDFNTEFPRRSEKVWDERIDGPRFQEVSLDEKTDVVGVPDNFPDPSTRSTRKPTRRPTRKTTTQKPTTEGVKYVRVGDKVYIVRENQKEHQFDENRFEDLGSESDVKTTRKPTQRHTTTTAKPNVESTPKPKSFTDKIKKVFSWFSS